MGLLLRGARCLEDGGWSLPRDVRVERGVVRATGGAAGGDAEVDLEGRFLLPALVNAHDVLDLSTLPPLGRPPYASLYEWTRAAEEDLARLAPALAVPLVDRLFLGGLRNLLAGVAAVLHHHPDHRSLAQASFPVRVQRRYGFAHSPGLTAALRRTYRTSDRRVPWLVRAAEGVRPGPAGGARRAGGGERAAAEHRDRARHGARARGRASPGGGPGLARLVPRERPPPLRPDGALRRAAGGGVSVGLGSDAPSAGARDALSNLAAARREGVLDDAALLRLATRDSAAVARLAPGGFEDGAPADLLAVDSPSACSRATASRSRSCSCGARSRTASRRSSRQAGRAAVAISVDGGRRALAEPLARRLATILRRHPAARGARWLSGVEL